MQSLDFLLNFYENFNQHPFVQMAKVLFKSNNNNNLPKRKTLIDIINILLFKYFMIIVQLLIK